MGIFGKWSSKESVDGSPRPGSGRLLRTGSKKNVDDTVAAVIGYSGQVGQAALKHLSDHSKRFSTFKAIGRSPEKAPQLPRVVGVKADATDVAALTEALSGVCRH